jgi:hypothetical protein
MNRRSIMVLLIGVISALTGFATAALLEQKKCLDASGRWDSALRKCELPTGDISGYGSRSIVTGVFVGVLLAIMLYRAVLFFTMRASRPSA